MNLLLVIREEAVCLLLLLYLMFYSRKFIRENDFFLRLNLFSLGHVVLDIVTIITVNHLDTVPLWLNSICHVLFYLFAIMFCCELLRFVLDVVYGKKNWHRYQWLVYLLPLVYLAATPFLRIDYLQGNGSNYSYGPCVFVGYGVAMLLFFSSEVLLLRNYSRLETNIKKILVPAFALMTLAEILQIFVPELLFTGAGVTLVSVGVFLSIVNPMEMYRERAFYDISLRIKNRNAYTDAMKRFAEMSSHELREHCFSLVVFDLNGLKHINDHFGHQVGDQYLRAAADIIQAGLPSAHGVFRTGGDEFVAIYLDTGLSVIQTELTDVQTACANRTMDYEPRLSVSYGYAVIKKAESVYSVERRADKEMFIYKRKFYDKAEC